MVKLSKMMPQVLMAISVIVIAVLLLRIHDERTHYEKLVNTLRTEIKEQIRVELAAEIQSLRGDALARRADDLLPALLIHETVLRERERTLSMVGASVLSDPLLDQYAAGQGIEPDMTVAGGSIQKSPQQNMMSGTVTNDEGGDYNDSQSPYDDGDEVPRPESIERTLQQRGSALLPKGARIFEPSFTYAHFSTNRINIQGVTILDVFTIGPVSTEKIQRDILIQTMSFKYGLAHNFQGEIKVPFRYEFNRISNTDGISEDTRSKGGLGDIDLSVSRQIGWEHGWKPDLIAGLGVKTNTGEPIYNNKIALGTGHWAVRGSLVAAKSSDPAVVFGSLSYTHSFKRRFDNYGMIEPGGTLGYSLGTAIALSYKTAINFSFDQSFTQKLKRNGEQVVGSFVNAANFKAGLNWAVNERASVDISAAVGLTTDSPAFTLEIRIPIRF